MRSSARSTWEKCFIGLLAAVAGIGSLVAWQLASLQSRQLARYSLEQAVSGFAPVSRKERARTAYARLDLSFEPNQGQANSSARFLSRGQGFGVFLTSSGPWLALQRTNEEQEPSSAWVRMRFAGANPDPVIRGIEPRPGRSNYLIGNEPSRWRTQIPHYGKVQYRDVYPGTDVVFYGNHRQLEYDLVLSPGADPARIELAFDGPQRASVDTDGDLVLETDAGPIRQRKPVVHQGEGDLRHAVAVRYVQTGDLRFRLELAEYDPGQTLVIDPVIVYSTYLGGSGADSAGAMDTRQVGTPVAIDAAGNAFVAGETMSLNFPTTAGAFQEQPQMDSDAFVTKIDPTGSTIIFSTYLGGEQADRANAIAIDSAGNPCVAGRTDSMSFPVQNALIASFRGGDYDAWMAKLSADGSTLMYSTYLGGSENDAINGIAVDSSDNIYVTGGTKSDDFPVTNGAFSEVISGDTDAFVIKIDPRQPGGMAFIYGTYLGGQFTDRGNGIAVDSAGNAYVVGRTASSNFPVMNAYQSTIGGGGADVFFTKLNSTGTALVYSTYLGGTSFDFANGVALDSVGRAYIVGETSSTNFPTLNGFQTSLGGGAFPDAFVAVMDPSQSGDASLVYSTYLGGNGSDRGTAIAVDSSGVAYLTGQTTNGSFPTTINAIQPSFGGGSSDAFVTKIDPSQPGAASLVYSSFLGGSSDETGMGIAADNAGRVWVVGQTTSSNFPVTAGAYQTTRPGDLDAFVTKIDTSATNEE